jgi:hypothetical protein
VVEDEYMIAQEVANMLAAARAEGARPGLGGTVVMATDAARVRPAQLIRLATRPRCFEKQCNRLVSENGATNLI